ncbi:hypothetical protein B296_00055831 [Ensete ventricosum]|uniref:Uncharacterized protein n=1 Tax=Ensete ventricosum TaxID=4639 RepID=A0A426X0Q1_ENSVE|nr:hypothetical protein B296_00055831 [Ensete ventricosum]
MATTVTTAAVASSSSYVASISRVLHRDSGSQSRHALAAKGCSFSPSIARYSCGSYCSFCFKISFRKWVTDGEWRKRKERGGCLLDGVANHPGFEVCPF